MTDEHQRIRSLQQRLHTERADITLGIGDDAAVLAPSEASQVVTVDTAVEGVHFRRDLASWTDIGYRALVTAVSDIGAMGAHPRASLVALVIPQNIDDATFDALIDGIDEAATETDAIVVGGNLSAGTELSITSTVIGGIDGAPLLRSGARVGDAVYVTGTLGDGALGLALLQAGRADDADEDVQHFIRAWRRPTPSLLVGRRIHGHASAAIDISDGLLQDLGHICRASSVGAEIEVELVPRAPSFERLAAEIERDPLTLALSSGDDYQLLFTAPASSTVKELATHIGRITDEPDTVRALDENAQPMQVERTGYRHFD